MRRYFPHFVAATLLVAICMASNLSGAALETPDPSLPEELKALAGKWTGSWNARNGWDCTITVERVSRDSARVIHAWGAYSPPKNSCHCSPGARTIEGAAIFYSKGEARLSFASPNANVKKTGKPRGSYSFLLKTSEPDVMQGELIGGSGRQMSAAMKKVR